MIRLILTFVTLGILSATLVGCHASGGVDVHDSSGVGWAR